MHPKHMPRRVLLESFISTQKMSVQKALRKKFKRYIVDRNQLQELVMHSLQVRGGASGPMQTCLP